MEQWVVGLIALLLNLIFGWLLPGIGCIVGGAMMGGNGTTHIILGILWIIGYWLLIWLGIGLIFWVIAIIHSIFLFFPPNNAQKSTTVTVYSTQPQPVAYQPIYSAPQVTTVVTTQ